MGKFKFKFVPPGCRSVYVLLFTSAAVLLRDHGNEHSSVSDGILHVQFKFYQSGWDTDPTRLLALLWMPSVLRAGQVSSACDAVPRSLSPRDTSRPRPPLLHSASPLQSSTVLIPITPYFKKVKKEESLTRVQWTYYDFTISFFYDFLCFLLQ